MSAEVVSAATKSWESLNDRPLRLRSGLRFRAEGPGNDWMCFLEDAEAGRSFAMAPWQRWFVELIEAKTPAQDAARLVITTFPDLVSRESLVSFVQWMLEEELFEEIETFQAKSSAPLEEEAVNVSSFRGLRLLGLHGRFTHLSMNGIAILLIALGGWILKPSAEDSPAENASVGVALLENERMIPIRAVSAGILTEVFVRDGDEVIEGDLIARIEDPVELQRLHDLKLQLGECRIRRDRYYKTSAAEDYRAEMRQIADLSRQIGISQARTQLAEMRAPVAGLVETEVLCGQVGSEVAQGDVLMKVHLPDEAARELLAGTP